MDKATSDRLDEMETDIREIRKDIKVLREDWQRARGLVAGIVLTISAITSAFVMVYKYITDRIGS